MSFTGLLNTTCSVYLREESAGSYGDVTVTENKTKVADSVACRKRQLSMTERDILMRQGVDANYRIYMDSTFTPSTNHRIKIGSDTFEVVAYKEPENLTGHHLEIDVRILS